MKSSVAAAVLSASLVSMPAFAAESSDASNSKPLALSNVNEKFRKDYATAKQEIKAQLGPLILCMNDDLILLKHKDRQTTNVIKARYTGLKEVSHIALDIFVLLTNHTDSKLDQSHLTRLEEFKEAVQAASSKIKTDEALVTSDDQRESDLVKESLAFLDKVIETKTVSENELTNFVRSTAKPDLENAYEAAGTQLTAMDNAVTKWREEMSADDWNKLHVVIVTHHMPRQELLAFQYFQKILHQTQEGDRIVVAETINDVTEDQAIDLLLTHMLDKKIAVSFFKDPWRMHRDLLSDGAKAWLEKHPPKALNSSVSHY